MKLSKTFFMSAASATLASVLVLKAADEFYFEPRLDDITPVLCDHAATLEPTPELEHAMNSVGCE